MKKKILLIPLALILVVSLVACAAPAPAPAPTVTAPATTVTAPAATVTAPAPAPALTKVNWKGVTSWAPTESLQLMAVDFGKKVTERTNGNFNLTVTVVEEIGIGRESIAPVMSKGLIQIGAIANGHAAGTYPWLGVFGLPFLVGGFEGVLADGAKVIAAVSPIATREFENSGLRIGITNHGTAVQMISKSLIEDVSDLKGLKVRAWDENTSRIIESLNGVPVVMGIGETYLAMQRGVVDAVLTGVPGMTSMSLYEPGKYLYLINLAPSSNYWCYNIETFEALPQEYQTILLEELEALDQRFKEEHPRSVEEALDVMRDEGVELVDPPADQKERLAAQVMPIWEEWASANPLNKGALDAVKKAFGLD